jgi:hypothetical protein
MQIRCHDCSFEFEVAEGVVRVLRSRSGTVACRKCHRPVPLDGKRPSNPKIISPAGHLSPPPTAGPNEVASLQEPTASPVPTTPATPDRPLDLSSLPAPLPMRYELRPPPLPELPSEWLVEVPEDESAESWPQLRELVQASRKADEVEPAKTPASSNPNMVTIPATVSTTSLFGEDTSLPPRHSNRARVVVAATLLGVAASAFVIHRGATHLPEIVAIATAKRSKPAAPVEPAPALELASHEQGELNASVAQSPPTRQDDPPESPAASAPVATESLPSTPSSAETPAGSVATLSVAKRPTSVTGSGSTTGERATSDLSAKPTVAVAQPSTSAPAAEEQQRATEESGNPDNTRAVLAAVRDEIAIAANADAIRQGMIQAATRAQDCHFPWSHAATVQVRVTFAATGEVKSTSLEPPGDASMTDCILTKFRALRIPPFSGNDVVAKKMVKIE